MDGNAGAEICLQGPTNDRGRLGIVNSASAVALFVPWVYTVGIVFDRLADDLFWKVAAPPILKRRKISEKHFKEACVLVIEKSGVASVDYYRYYLSRVRIVRAAVINVRLLMLTAYVVYRFESRIYVPAPLR